MLTVPCLRPLSAWGIYYTHSQAYDTCYERMAQHTSGTLLRFVGVSNGGSNWLVTILGHVLAWCQLSSPTTSSKTYVRSWRTYAHEFCLHLFSAILISYLSQSSALYHSFLSYLFISKIYTLLNFSPHLKTRSSLSSHLSVSYHGNLTIFWNHVGASYRRCSTYVCQSYCLKYCPTSPYGT